MLGGGKTFYNLMMRSQFFSETMSLVYEPYKSFSVLFLVFFFFLHLKWYWMAIRDAVGYFSSPGHLDFDKLL